MPKRPEIPPATIAQSIIVLRGTRVLLDRDLANLYGVRPTSLRQQVKRNASRFPADFMFQLTARETLQLVSQSVIPSRKMRGGSLLYVFTEQGVASISSLFDAIRQLLSTPKPSGRPIGFTADLEGGEKSRT